MTPWRLLLASLGLLACATWFAGEASAASRVCRQLEAQLASAGGGSSQSRRYDRAIERQRGQLSIARKQARAAGCGFALLSRNARQCASLNTTIERMQSNLEDLQRSRGQMGGGKSRTAILAALDANGCRDGGGQQVASARKPVAGLRGSGDNRTLLGTLFGGEAKRAASPRAEPEKEQVASIPLGKMKREEIDTRVRRIINHEDDSGIASLSETYATMCVRSCDGYFFPMSQQATMRDFERDQKNCESSCPGTKMEVFYRAPGSQDESSMTSANTGQPYSSLPNAYLYKNASMPSPQGCGCNAGSGFTVIAGNPPKGGVTQVLGGNVSSAPAKVEAVSGSIDRVATIEPPKPVVAEDARSFDHSVVALPTQAEGAERKVRVVGPVFLPDPEGAIDLRAPARTPVQ